MPLAEASSLAVKSSTFVVLVRFLLITAHLALGNEGLECGSATNPATTTITTPANTANSNSER